MAATAEGLLYYDGQTIDPDDFDYEETIEIRRLVRVEIWDEATHGPFDWRVVDEFMLYPAMLTVFKQRDDPEYTLDQALKLKLSELRDTAPPTEPAPKPRSNGTSRSKPKAGSAGNKTPAATGSQS